MTRLILTLLASTLAIGAAQASECRSTDISLKQGARVLRVTEAGYYQGKADDTEVERTVFRAALSGKTYVIDAVAIQGASFGGAFSSAGRAVTEGEIPVRWDILTPAYRDGESFRVIAGPMEGDWKVRCRG